MSSCIEVGFVYILEKSNILNPEKSKLMTHASPEIWNRVVIPVEKQ